MNRSARYCPIALLAVVLAVVPHSRGTAQAADIPTRGPVINIVEWDGGTLPPVFDRSDQLPLTGADIRSLSQHDFSPEQIAKMVGERRFVGDASAAGLIDLKKSGVAPEVIQAVSRHALPPNRALSLTIRLEFEGTSREARKRYLYVIVPDGEIERIFTADLGSVLAGRWRQDTTVDRTDLVLPKHVRQVTFSGEVPLKTYGQKTIRVFTSTRPGIYTSADIPEADVPGIKTYTINYPVSSLLQHCELQVRYKQDPVVPYKWEMVGSYLQCEWH